MVGDLFINGKDAYTTWGVSLDENALSTLMTPVAIKPLVENKGRGADGKQVLGLGNSSFATKVDEREISITIHLSASSQSDFATKYASFCKELEKGRLDIRTRWQAGVTYHFIYLSCTQFSMVQSLASFSLRLNEPNPRNRV